MAYGAVYQSLVSIVAPNLVIIAKKHKSIAGMASDPIWPTSQRLVGKGLPCNA